MDVAAARWLVSPAGHAAISIVQEFLESPGDRATHVMRATQHLRDSGTAADHTRAAIDAAVARIKARTRWRNADDLVTSTDALEQASDPAVATWRAMRTAVDTPVIDMCAGLGADVVATALRAGDAIAVDHDPARLVFLNALAESHRAPVRSHHATAEQAAAMVSAAHHVLADPSRRSEGRRRLGLDALQPPITFLRDTIARGTSGALVLPPGIDLHDPLVDGGELEFIQREGQLLEAVLWLGDAKHPGVAATATILADDGPTDLASSPSVRATRSRIEVDTDVAVGPIGNMLLDFAPALVRARLHRGLGNQLDARRISRNRALMTVDALPPPSPWYVARAIEAVLPYQPKQVRRWLRSAEAEPIEIAVHGVDVAPEQFWQLLGRPMRGPHGRRLELVRTEDGVVVLATRTCST